MKAVFEQVPFNQMNSFVFRRFELPRFDAPFHFHPEYELTLILKGEGQRYVGGQVDNFSAGDLVFLGSNLPHCWLGKPVNDEDIVEAIVIQFDESFLGNTFFEIPEAAKIKELLHISKAGISIRKDLKEKLIPKIIQLTDLKPLNKLLILIEILDEIANADATENIDFAFSKHDYNNTETARFQKIFSYLIEHFTQEISLEEMANIADLSPTSFCRYFKNITKKTFVEVLIEFRLQYACQLLKKTDLPIHQIAFDSGFGDVPYFNKQFRKHKGFSPLVFRKAEK